MNIRFDFIRFFMGDYIEAIVISKEDGSLILIHSLSLFRVQGAEFVHREP
jgi:hypothetical protein